MPITPKRTYFEWLRLYFMIHIGVLLLIIGALFGFIFVQSSLRQMRYEPVQGTILISKSEPCPNGMFRPKITFSYTVDQRTLTTGKYRDDGMRICLSETEVKDLLAKYPHGAVVEAWYDPKHVKFAVLDRSPGIIHKLALIYVAAVSVILLCALWRYRVGKSEHQAGMERVSQ